MSTTIEKLTSRFFLAPALLFVLLPSTAGAQTCRETYSGFAACLTQDGSLGTIYFPYRSYSPWLEPFSTYDLFTGEPCSQIEPLPSAGTICHDDWPANPVVVGLTAIWSRVDPRQCDELGTDWWSFAWDGKAELLYCERLSGSLPETAAVSVTAIWGGRRGSPADCSTLGGDWSTFVFDGSSNMNFCIQNGSTAGGYIRQMSAVWRGSCENIQGGNWTTVIWNGNSEISFCADFNR